jgi:hypothetical protein
MTANPPDDETAAAEAYADLQAAAEKAIEATRVIADNAAAFSAAQRLVRYLRDKTQEAGQVHARAAARIHQAESLSLAALAKRIGVSKARADQLVNPRPKSPKRKASQP